MATHTLIVHEIRQRQPMDFLGGLSNIDSTSLVEPPTRRPRMGDQNVPAVDATRDALSSNGQ